MIIALVLLLLVLFAVDMALRQKINDAALQKIDTSSVGKSGKVSTPLTLTDDVIVQSDDATQKVNISTGAISTASALEKQDFSGFQGFPKLGTVGNKDSEQSSVLTSLDQSQAIVTVSIYDASDSSKSQDNQPVLSSADYLCDVSQNSCQLTDILSQAYQGLDPSLQKDDAPLIWFKWDQTKNLIFGHLTLDNVGDVSPVYVCDTQKKTCSTTVGFDSSKSSDTRAVVPDGSFSPYLDKFVMVSQHDNPNVETGKTWELLLYGTDDLSKPARSYDISSIIDRDQNVAYDSVYSVSWTQDEKHLAIGTSRRIFMFDLDSGSLSLAYIAPTDGDGDYYWDTSSLFLSPDGKYIAFVDSTDSGDDNSSDSATSSDDTTNILKKIDLGNANKVTAMYSGKGLSLQF